ncbi:low temperature requirement protein A [Streptomyces sp. DSM 44938]|uniref:Low temperature requirement protein A n=2 Tax=Streptomyces litchfieldiae TaxID=3075543 RepID=A0ABU2MPP1_9ACTN|nr:low temperature requirement protein A [Streptomyces sp. DSM 44938]MDT0342609.1 low temperature requirement protein A [Streptomyces sp. DSM 44938]
MHEPWHRPMTARDSTERHRTATPLELFFDLCFVVAVGRVAGELHHSLSAGHVTAAVLSFLAVFFATWWAWMAFTWFASAYDTDDVPYRVTVLVTITGALVLAAGVHRAFEEHDFSLCVLGYTIIRLALISLWLRVAHSHPEGRVTAHRFAGGLTLVQALWIGWLALPTPWQMPLFPVIALLDVALPVWAERAHPTPWHPHHIAERYGLFTIIVLGESVLAATTATRTAVDAHRTGPELLGVAAGGLLTVFAMWWLYFAKPAERFLVSTRAGFLWGYGHYLVFGAAAAVGAGIAVNLDFVTHHSSLAHPAAAAAVTVPVAVYVLALWLLHLRPHHVGRGHALLFPTAALLVLAATATPAPVLLTGVTLAALVAAGTALAR